MTACEFCQGEKCKGECQDPSRNWTLRLAQTLCVALEDIAPVYGAHVALTGGVLYKNGPRKDCDIVLYRHGGRQEPIDRLGILEAVQVLMNMIPVRTEGRVWKLTTHDGRQVDFLFHDTEEAAFAAPSTDGSSGG